MRKFLSLAILVLVMVSQNALASTWLHKAMPLSNNISMSLDYIVNYIGYNDEGGPAGYLAAPWINISGSGLSPFDQVSVVLINYSKPGGMNDPYTSPMTVSNQTIPLQYDANQSKFTAQAKTLVLANPQIYGSSFYQEVAVEINGNWYKNGWQNFRFQMPLN